MDELKVGFVVCAAVFYVIEEIVVVVVRVICVV